MTNKAMLRGLGCKLKLQQVLAGAHKDGTPRTEGCAALAAAAPRSHGSASESRPPVK